MDFFNKRHQRWLHLPVEVRVREFDAKLLLGCLAVKRGYHVTIGKKNPLIRGLPKLPSGIIFERSIAPRRAQDFVDFKKQGFSVCANDEESIFFYQHHEAALKQRTCEKSLSQLDYFFCWGKNQETIMSKAFPHCSDKFITSGTYRNDICRPEFAPYWESKVSELRKRYGDFILFPSNFSRAMHVRGGHQEMLALFQKHGAITTKKDQKFYAALLNHTTQSLQTFKKVLPEIRQAFPNHTLIIRHHPGELPVVWEELAKDDQGMIAIHEGPIQPWLMAAVAVFHHGCSTGLEAFCAGTPAISYHENFNDIYDRHLSTRIGPVARNSEELIEYLTAAIERKGFFKNDVSWLDGYIYQPLELS